MRTNIPIYTILSTLMVLFCACFDNEQTRVIPQTPVSIYAELSLPLFSPLQYDGNAIVVPGYGYQSNGIIVYRYTNAVNAYDCTCPNCMISSEQVSVIALDGLSSGTATCPVCSAQYMLLNGWASNFDYPLQAYTATITGNTLHVHN